MPLPHLILIAGTESQGRAGLHSDLRAVSALPVRVSSVITCVTAQPQDAAFSLLKVGEDMLEAQLAAALQLGPPQAIKVGLLGSSAALALVNQLPDRLRRIGIYDCRLIFDPVMRSSARSGGQPLFSISHQAWLAALSVADLVTPNLDEASWLLDWQAEQVRADPQRAAKTLAHRLGNRVLLKGGHGDGQSSVDWLCDGARCHAFERRRLALKTRGTGCYLASAVAARSALGQAWARACLEAGDQLHAALRCGQPPAL